MSLDDVRLTPATREVCLQILRHPGLSYGRIGRSLGGITRQGVRKHVLAACRRYPRLARHLVRPVGRPSTRPLPLDN